MFLFLCSSASAMTGIEHVNAGPFRVDLDLKPYIDSENLNRKALEAESNAYSNYTSYSFTVQEKRKNQIAAITINVYNTTQLGRELMDQENVNINLIGYLVEPDSITTSEIVIDSRKGCFGSGKVYSDEYWYAASYWIDEYTCCIIVSNFERKIIIAILDKLKIKNRYAVL
jgi:hypothetical protein